MKRPKNGDLPGELVLDILLRLPVDVMSVCKCVCKEWCLLIESPSFVKKHFEKERNQERLLIRRWEPKYPEEDKVNEEPNQNGQEIVEGPDQEVDYHEAMLRNFLEEEEYYRLEARRNEGDYKFALYVDGKFTEHEVPYHLQMPYEVDDLIGPVNGVYCVVTAFPQGPGPMALLNPALRQFKPLPLVERPTLQNPCFFESEVGLGLDPLTGDYKIVLLLYSQDITIGDRHCSIHVCTSESDSWRLLEDVDPSITSRRARKSVGVTFLNGVYYWLLEFNHTVNNKIISFDMLTEKFQEIPVVGPVAQSETDNLALCGDSLALLIYDLEERFINVWMMVDEGCWIRRSRVGPIDSFKQALCFWKNDVLFFLTVMDLLAQCDMSTRESKILEAATRQYDYERWVIPYKESLVSIKGKAGKCKLWDTSSDFIKNFFKY